MTWMDTPLRGHPNKLFPEAKFALVVALNYGPERNPLPELKDKNRPYISVYARNEDYHDVMKKRLKTAAREMNALFGCDAKVFVDTAPLAEKPLAQKAGAGWQGKHTNLVSRELGSWFFLGVILTTEELIPDPAEVDHCGSCRKCLTACPTDAFPVPYQLDARKCISYLTIEHKGLIPPELGPKFGNRVYGCDDCLAVCPWNKFAQTGKEAAFHSRETIKNMTYAEILSLSDAEFRAFFSKSPIKRIKRARFFRNILNAVINLKKFDCLPTAERLLQDEEDMIRASALRTIAALSSDEEKVHHLLDKAQSDNGELMRQEALRIKMTYRQKERAYL